MSSCLRAMTVCGWVRRMQLAPAWSACLPSSNACTALLLTRPSIFPYRPLLTPATTAGLVGELAEQLRLILEPTLARRLAGDYRSGKRITMKKVRGGGRRCAALPLRRCINPTKSNIDSSTSTSFSPPS